ncbi:MAG TPA: DNA polymerase III subunit psi [Candidatus Berkiella sp.]|nr:DNA polymerase III subunit psi [Candidatus Berkiella sp.]
MGDALVQSEYLAMLGITQWEKRSPHLSPAHFRVIIDEQGITAFAMLSPQKQQLLTRMLAALKWPQQETQFCFERMENGALLQFAKGDKRITLPSLTALLEEKTAKQDAWQLMQSAFIDA